MIDVRNNVFVDTVFSNSDYIWEQVFKGTSVNEEDRAKIKRSLGAYFDTFISTIVKYSAAIGMQGVPIEEAVGIIFNGGLTEEEQIFIETYVRLRLNFVTNLNKYLEFATVEE